MNAIAPINVVSVGDRQNVIVSEVHMDGYHERCLTLRDNHATGPVPVYSLNFRQALDDSGIALLSIKGGDQHAIMVMDDNALRALYSELHNRFHAPPINYTD